MPAALVLCRRAATHERVAPRDFCCPVALLISWRYADFRSSQVGKAGAILRPVSSPGINIAKLKPAERLQLIEELWESLRQTPELVPLTDAQRQELDGRLDEIDGGDTAGIPWDEVLHRIRTGMR